jgi:hypothetical protein
MPEEVFIDFDIIEMIAANRANTGIARAKIIEPERSALRLFQVARALFKRLWEFSVTSKWTQPFGRRAL